MGSALHTIPLAWFRPVRLGAVRFRRGTILRNICIAILKYSTTSRSIAKETDLIAPLDEHVIFEACDSMIIDTIYWYGVQGYEGILTNVWKMLCRDAAHVLEIGGNIGLYSVIGAVSMRTGKYTVVEPLPELVAILGRNVARNLPTCANDRVEILEGAAIPGQTPRFVDVSIPSEGRNAPVGAHLTHDVELRNRSSSRVIRVSGIPITDLIIGCDVIKIDAEGAEYELLSCIRTILAESRPTIVIEVLPEAEKLGKLISSLALECPYTINVIPAYGSETVVTVPAEQFTSMTPSAYRSKDVVLSRVALV